MKVLSFGSLNMDFVYQVDHFVRPGETMSSQQRDTFCGGKGLNQSIALARAGAQVYHAGAIGADGMMLKEVLEKDGINTEFVKICQDVPTGHAIIQVDKKGQNCIMLYGGANQTITPEDVDKALAAFGQGDFLVLQNEINGLPYLMEQAHKKGMCIVLNPSPMNEKILALPLDYVDIFMLNEVEASDICGVDAQQALGALHAKYPHAKIVLTLGKQGVKYQDGDTILSHGIYKVPVVDTTAAGDTFTGYFIGGIAQGQPVEEALRLASVASSLAVSRQGAEPSIPYAKEVRESQLQPE